MGIINIICIFQHQEIIEITHETKICVILSAIYENEAGRKKNWPQKMSKKS